MVPDALPERVVMATAYDKPEGGQPHDDLQYHATRTRRSMHSSADDDLVGGGLRSIHGRHRAGTPDIDLVVTMPSETLFGTPSTVTLTATNPSATDGYNLSFNDKLPPGATLRSADPAPSRTLTDGTGRLVLIWENVADLQAGTTESITYTFLAPDPAFDIGDVVTDSAGAYVNIDPHFVPDFHATTGDATTDVSGFDNVTVWLGGFRPRVVTGDGDLLTCSLHLRPERSRRRSHASSTIYSDLEKEISTSRHDIAFTRFA